LLTLITPTGVMTGFGFAPASCNDHSLAETFFAARQQPSSRLPSVGKPAQGVYVADKLLNTFRLARERPHALDG
jgi:hypothetical protein